MKLDAAIDAQFSFDMRNGGVKRLWIAEAEVSVLDLRGVGE